MTEFPFVVCTDREVELCAASPQPSLLVFVVVEPIPNRLKPVVVEVLSVTLLLIEVRNELDEPTRLLLPYVTELADPGGAYTTVKTSYLGRNGIGIGALCALAVSAKHARRPSNVRQEAKTVCKDLREALIGTDENKEARAGMGGSIFTVFAAFNREKAFA